MDLSRLAEDYVGCGLRPMAGILLVLCLLPPVVALLYSRHRGRVHALAVRIAAAPDGAG